MKNLVPFSLLAAGLVFPGMALYRIKGGTSKPTNMEEITSGNGKERINIFEPGFSEESGLISLVSNNAIDEDSLDKKLRPLMREKLRTIFLRKGWNFDELKGRIYYQVKGKNLEVYVAWKKGLFDQDWSHYDHFTISFSN